MRQRESSDRSEATAAAWAARLDRGALDDGEDQQLRAWEAADPRHAGALLRAQAVLVRFDRLRGFGSDGFAAMQAEQPLPTFTRRRLVGVGAGAIALSVAAVVGRRWLETDGRSFASARGEVRSIALEDGSTLTLDTATTVRVAYGTNVRRVLLDYGRAMFDVAKDADRPFIVEAGPIYVRAIGTSFSVDREANNIVQIVMRQGVTEITRSGIPESGQRMVAAETLRIAPGSTAEPIRHDAQAIDRVLAWRESMIEFDDEPLVIAAAAFARYSNYRVRVAPTVAELRVTGRFSAADPRGFALAAGESLGLTVRDNDREATISR